uniref:Histone acetyltransferase n=1 Tax=Panagrolaimus sp. ES5 TaxID=591445 RepID=A0AC34F5A7_9BILA
MSTSISYWDSVGNRIIRFVNLHHSESSSKEDSSPTKDKSGMNHRNDENRGRKRTDKVDHVVETRSRTRASFSSPNPSNKSASNTPSPAINGFHDEESIEENKSFAMPTISPRKLKELRELNESSTWKDPSVGKHPRPTRRSLTSQRTSPRMPALKVAPQSSTPNIFPIRPSTRSQVKQNGSDTNGIILDSPQPSTSASLLNGVQKRRISLRHEHQHHFEPVSKKQRVNKLKLKIPSRISRIKKRPIKRPKFKPYKTKKVLAFETADIEDPETFETIESLKERCMKKKIPVKKSKVKTAVKIKVKRPPRASDSAFAIVPETLENVKVDESKAAKAIIPIMAFTEKKLPRISLSERTYTKRCLRLKRPSDANFLLPFPRSRLRNSSKVQFKIATKRIKPPPLKNGIKWLALLTPCQRSCNCMRFQTKRVKWEIDIPNEEDVNALRTDELCSCCHHSLWVHRRKYDVEDRRKRYAVLRDIIIVQKMLSVETNKENLRVLFVLLKDLMFIIIENQALPKECFPFKNSLIHELSVRRHIQAYMQTKEARKLGFLNRHAQDLLQTLEEFVFPPPNQIEQYSYTFKFKKYTETVVEKTFLTWYRHFYLRWLVFCRLPYFLNSLPKYETCNIMSFQFIELFAESIALKLEEKFAETDDPGVKVVAVMFRRLRLFAKTVVTISKRNIKRLTMKGYGSNVLEEDYDSIPQSPDAMETRHTPALDLILQEQSGPFTYIQHFEDDSQPLEVTCPLPFAKYFWKLAKKRKYKLFLDSIGGPKNAKPLTLRHDPNTLSDFEAISHDIQKTMRVSRWRSNCDKERAAGKIEMIVLRNIKSTTSPKQNDFLMQFISVIHRQLPKMPKHYIIRLVMDGKHRSMILLKYLNRGSSPGWAVLGGICFRPFKTQSFSEIVFVAVHADHQVRGYGSYLMDQLKRYHVEHLGFPHLLTFADKNAIVYFKKQGFSKDIGLPHENFHRYIKEYEGATLMYCHSRLCNTPEDELYWAHKLKKHLRNLYFELCPEWNKIYEGLEKKFLERDLLPMKVDRFEQIDNYGFGLFYDEIGLPQLFWKRQYELIELDGGPIEEEEFFSEDEHYGREDPFKEESEDDEDDYGLVDELTTPEWKEPDDEYIPEEENSTQMMFMLVEAIARCPYSWPFHYPVDEYDAPTYSEDLNQAMTLEIIEDRLDWGYYIHERMLFLDFARVFINCYAFNEQQDGPYYHACYRLHQYFNAIAIQIFGDRVAPYLLPIAKASSFRKPNQKADQVVFDPLRPYWYPIRVLLPPPPPTPKLKKTPKKKLAKTRSKSIGSTSKKRIKSQTPVREKTPSRKLSTNSAKKIQTKLVFNQSSSAGYHLEFLDETTAPDKRTTRAAARTPNTTPSNSARRRRR